MFHVSFLVNSKQLLQWHHCSHVWGNYFDWIGSWIQLRFFFSLRIHHLGFLCILTFFFKCIFTVHEIDLLWSTTLIRCFFFFFCTVIYRSRKWQCLPRTDWHKLVGSELGGIEWHCGSQPNFPQELWQGSTGRKRQCKCLNYPSKWLPVSFEIDARAKIRICVCAGLQSPLSNLFTRQTNQLRAVYILGQIHTTFVHYHVEAKHQL